MTPPEDKQRSLDDLEVECASWRERGLEVVLVNGAFDVLHVGHLRYLAAARALGDRLVVAVNSDLSVRSSKGELRPIVPQNERVETLSHLWMVDRICLFDDLTVATGPRKAPPLDPRQGNRLHRRHRPRTGGGGRLRRAHRDLRRPEGPRDDGPDWRDHQEIRRTGVNVPSEAAKRRGRVLQGPPPPSPIMASRGRAANDPPTPFRTHTAIGSRARRAFETARLSGLASGEEPPLTLLARSASPTWTYGHPTMSKAAPPPHADEREIRNPKFEIRNCSRMDARS